MWCPLNVHGRSVVGLLVIALCLVAACKTTSSSSTDTTTTVDDGTADPPDGGVHAITSATPLAKNALLTSTHSGWKKADCTSCHESDHSTRYRPAACANCHGSNGAPGRSRANHPKLASCPECHLAVHQQQQRGFAAEDCLSCHVYPPSETCGFTETYDVVVVGAGGGGLGAAAALARAGKKVLVLEKNFKVGGCMGAFQRGDFRFEASLHGFDGLVEGSGMNVAIFKHLGLWNRLDILRLDPMYRAVYPDASWDIPADADKFQALLKDSFPTEAKGIDALFTEMRDLHRILREVVRSQVTGSTPDVTVAELQRVSEYGSKTLMEVLDGYITDPKLVAVLTQLASFAGTEPRKVSAVFFMALWCSFHLGGYHYFAGGSEALAEALASVIRDGHGVIRTGSLVTKIVVNNNRATQVRTADGACYNADYVVSNANAPDTVNKLVGADKFPADYVAKMSAMPIGLSAFVVYLGVDRDYREQFDGTHAIRVKVGYDTHRPFQAIDDCAPEETEFSIVNVTQIDPTNAPKGKNVIVITSMVSYDCNDAWQWNESRASYKAYKQEIAETFIRRAEAILPGLSAHVEVMEVATPLTIKGYTLNPRGTYFGWDNPPEHSVRNRLPAQTPIANLYLAGAWTAPGGGQSAVISSGAQTALMILQAMSAP